MDEQSIIKALQVCPTNRCMICPLRKRVDCRDYLVKETLKIIISKNAQLKQDEEQLQALERKIVNLKETMDDMVGAHKIIIKDLMEQMNGKGDHTEYTDEGW